MYHLTSFCKRQGIVEIGLWLDVLDTCLLLDTTLCDAEVPFGVILATEVFATSEPLCNEWEIGAADATTCFVELVATERGVATACEEETTTSAMPRRRSKEKRTMINDRDECPDNVSNGDCILPTVEL